MVFIWRQAPPALRGRPLLQPSTFSGAAMVLEGCGREVGRQTGDLAFPWTPQLLDIRVTLVYEKNVNMELGSCCWYGVRGLRVVWSKGPTVGR